MTHLLNPVISVQRMALGMSALITITLKQQYKYKRNPFTVYFHLDNYATQAEAVISQNS